MSYHRYGGFGQTMIDPSLLQKVQIEPMVATPPPPPFNPNPKTMEEWNKANYLWQEHGGYSSPWPPPTKPQIGPPFNPTPGTEAEYQAAYQIWVSLGGTSSGWPPPLRPTQTVAHRALPAPTPTLTTVALSTTGRPTATAMNVPINVLQPPPSGTSEETLAQAIAKCQQMGGQFNSATMQCDFTGLTPETANAILQCQQAGGSWDWITNQCKKPAAPTAGAGTVAVVGAAALAALALLR